MSARRFLVLAAGVACISVAANGQQKNTPRATAQAMGDGEARALLVGKSMLFADHSIARYGADGAYTYIAANNMLFTGTYSIDKGRLCLRLDDRTARCDTLRRDRLGAFMETENGVQLRFSPTLAPLPQHTAKPCDVPMAYNVYPPAANVPDKLRAFSGVWLGKWDDGLCSALIVESVLADGTATLIYVNGSKGGEYSTKPGATRFVGMIDGNKLSNGRSEYYTEYVLIAPDELRGAYTVPRRGARGRFYRQPTPR